MCYGKTPESIMNLRPRVQEKELGPPNLIFKAKTRLESVKEAASKNNLSVMSTSENMPSIKVGH